MRRRAVHAAFGLFALLSGGAMVQQASHLRHLLRINEAVASMPDRVRDGTDVVSTSDPEEVVLARAAALARAGDTDGADRNYNELIATARTDAAGRSALYDLGNLYLRQGMHRTGETASSALPMIELAKQRYRDLLKMEPEAWDARFNLERALRLAPEVPLVFDDAEREPVDRRKAMAPDLLAPELP